MSDSSQNLRLPCSLTCLSLFQAAYLVRECPLSSPYYCITLGREEASAFGQFQGLPWTSELSTS